MYFSYSENNMLMSSKYIRYAEQIDDWLKDRPRPMVKHCLLKKSIAEQMDLTGIRVIGAGRFSIRYHKENIERNYITDFGSENEMPSCTCFDWKRSCYPCKHFFAIFKKFPCYGWESVSSLYRNSPYLNLDSDFFVKSPKESIIGDSEEMQNSSFNFEMTELPPPPKKRKVKITGDSLRSLTMEVKNLSYLIENDEELLEKHHNNLQVLVESMKNSVPKESGIPLLPKKEKNSFSISKKIKSSDKFHDLPARKRPNILSKRVGERNNILTKASEIDVAVKERVKTVETEVITDGLDYNNLCSFRGNSIVISSGESEAEEFQIPFNVNISDEDLEDLRSNEMLSDNVINLFQNMIKRKFKDANGLQDTVLGQTLQFDVQRNKPFVQILHDGRFHWVAISSYGCQEGEIFLMDSLFSGRIANHTKRQICCILNCASDELKVKVLPVQQQTNGVDCGVFAVAFVYHILSTKKTPTDISFEERRTRSHIVNCIGKNEI